MQDLERGVTFREERIRRLQLTGDLADNKSWQAMAKEIELSLDACKAQLESLASGSVRVIEGSTFEAEARRIGGQITSYRGILFNVSDAQKQIDRLNDQIGQMRQEIRTLREKQGGKNTKTLSTVV
jgi:peptidoglycan hydrolase CwlO-like protein